MIRLNFFSLLLLGSLIGVAIACSQEGAGNEETKAPVAEANEALVEDRSRLEEDAAFLVEVYSYNLMISDYGEQAKQKASTPALQDFATHSILFHEKLNKEIADMAAAKGITLPAGIGKDVQQHIEKLKGKEAKAFDKAYLNVLAKIQDDLVSKYEEVAGGAYDEDFKNWASHTLPSIKAHALTTEELEKKVN
jgi:putative membrane protein